jgi:hypothetical protein
MPTLTLTSTTRSYKLDEPISHIGESGKSRFTSRNVKITWRRDVKPMAQLVGPNHEVLRNGEWVSVGGFGGSVPIPVPDWVTDER